MLELRNRLRAVGMVVAAAFACVAGDAAVADGGGPEVWAGSVQLQGPTLVLTLRLQEGADGSWAGTVDIPEQGFAGVVVAGFARSETAMEFTLPFPGMPENLIPSFELVLDKSGEHASGIMRQAGRTFPVTLDRTTEEAIVASAQDRRPQTPRPPFPYRNESVEVRVAPQGMTTHDLAGTLTLPDAGEFGDGPYPCAVLLTGSGPQDRDETLFEHKPFAVIADALARAGIASLRCDDRGIAASGGDFAASDSYDFANDAMAQVDYVRGRPEIDASKVGLIGHSEGGLTAAIVASRARKEVAFVVTLAGMGLTGRETLLGQAEKTLRLGGREESFVARNRELQTALFDLVESGASEEEQAAAMRALVVHQMAEQAAMMQESQIDQVTRQQMSVFRSKWMQTLLTLDPAAFLDHVSQPILVMNGELDSQVLPDTNLAAITGALEAAGNGRVTVRRYPGLNHLFQNAETGALSEYDTIHETFDPHALQDLVDWVVATTRG
ncbi:MAG: alpha/beta fold hydrolase [Phycisphaeraceae bacterium]|nr:alpha/beta fold hydrolase [Phycisphaeraceae bacterium]MCB9847204.1 alpha/beta fold hydrolase [Phycisphaeraceae bacterium]